MEGRAGMCGLFLLGKEISMTDRTRIAEGLAAYSIERRYGVERHRPEGAPTWDEVRCMWISAVLGEMDDWSGGGPSLLTLYNQRMEQAGKAFATEPASPQLQQDTIKGLAEYVRGLANTGSDTRRQIYAARELLEDMASHLPWAKSADSLDRARDQTDRELRRMTALQPIRFTRVLLGWETGPCVSAFLPGSVRQESDIRASDFFDEMSWRYGTQIDWPALCTVYAGRGGGFGLRDADEFDVGIMNEAGDKFLDEPGVTWIGGPHEVILSPEPGITMQ